jgi:hypothetical protein
MKGYTLGIDGVLELIAEPTLDEKLHEFDDAKENLEKQSACFRNVLKDRANISDEDYDSYCEEMQYALERHERAEKSLGYF